jgi:hypothetical protein
MFPVIILSIYFSYISIIRIHYSNETFSRAFLLNSFNNNAKYEIDVSAI